MSTDSKEFDPKPFLRRLTESPGVYQMLGDNDELLYVGKARNLKNRVSSYFAGTKSDPRIRSMVAQVQSIEVIVTRTEGEALLLENQLIKNRRPRYNVLLRDDKSYPFIYLSDDKYPRLAFHRGARKKPGRYFGPFPSAGAVRESLNQMQKLFRIRQCEDSFFRNRSRPCLQYQIERCTGPCVDLITPERYAQDVRHATLFLEGRSQSVINELAQTMETASKDLNFELAAQIRDRIAALKKVQAQQFITGASGSVDIVGLSINGGQACIQVMVLRDNRNLGSRAFYPKTHGIQDPSMVIRAFLLQYYLDRELPKEILISEDFEDRSEVAELFSQEAGRKVRLVARARGDRAGWVRMAQRNAELSLESRLASRAGISKRYESLTEILGLDETPERMECFDISHTQGEATVASCVVFGMEGPLNSEYRRFNIKGVAAGDDYGAMKQALTRRYKRLKAGEAPMPDLLIIDGGKGQVAQALEMLEELQIDQVQVVGVAKGPERRAGDEVLILGKKRKELRPDSHAPGMHLLQQIRDEAHRFAITGHRGRRGKPRQQSTLEEIPGIGAKRRKALLTRFGGLKGVLGAGVEELAAIDGINQSLAQRIYDALHGD